MGEDRGPAKAGSLRARIAEWQKALVGPRSIADVAAKTGIEADMLRKVLRAERMLSPAKWESFAAAVGLDDYRGIFPPPQKSSEK